MPVSVQGRPPLLVDDLRRQPRSRPACDATIRERDLRGFRGLGHLRDRLGPRFKAGALLFAGREHRRGSATGSAPSRSALTS